MKASSSLRGLSIAIRPWPVAVLLSIITPTPVDATAYVVDRTDDDPSATACTATPNDCGLRGAILAAGGHVLVE